MDNFFQVFFFFITFFLSESNQVANGENTLFISAEHDHNMNQSGPSTSLFKQKKVYKAIDWSDHYSGNKKEDPFDKRSYQYLTQPNADRVVTTDQRAQTPYDSFNVRRIDHSLPEILLAIDKEDESPLYRNCCRENTAISEIDNQTKDEATKQLFQNKMKKEFL